MASLFSEGECLYAALGVSTTATESEIARAYKKKALMCHPDRIKGKSNEKEMEELFKKVGFAYSILKDEGKKRIYDRTGEFEGGAADDSSLSAMMKALFKEVTEEQVESFFETYVGSEEELQDICSAYNESKGNFAKIRDLVNYNDSLESEEDRLVSIIDEQIALGNLKSTNLWKKTKITEEVKKTAAYKKRWARRHKETEEAKIIKKKLKKSKGTKEGDLALAMKDILQNGGFEDIVSQLSAKYAAKEGDDDGYELPIVDEEKFQAAKRRLAAKRASNTDSDSEQEQVQPKRRAKKKVIKRKVKKTTAH
eukprot:TRINITY_DN20334_c0_g1_i1.p1 TRINITY_DN20334_c0_g1~~TRINITY_DN20334_c0_g1_i1.p1  ORF type:complete len:310 (+),score=82.11 TRINITY_DN20334_c0_g1_i1:40-969(+)